MFSIWLHKQAQALKIIKKNKKYGNNEQGVGYKTRSRCK